MVFFLKLFLLFAKKTLDTRTEKAHVQFFLVLSNELKLTIPHWHSLKSMKSTRIVFRKHHTAPTVPNRSPPPPILSHPVPLYSNRQLHEDCTFNRGIVILVAHPPKPQSLVQLDCPSHMRQSVEFDIGVFQTFGFVDGAPDEKGTQACRPGRGDYVETFELARGLLSLLLW